MTDASLVHVASRQYRLACNWKVFVDNYLVRACQCGGQLSACKQPWTCQCCLDALEPSDRQASSLQDGGYHVEVAHPGLAAGLHLLGYRSELYERVSIQSCPPKAAAAQPRLGEMDNQPYCRLAAGTYHGML